MPEHTVVAYEWPKPAPCPKCDMDLGLDGIHLCLPLLVEQLIEALKKHPQYVAPFREALGIDAHEAPPLEK